MVTWRPSTAAAQGTYARRCKRMTGGVGAWWDPVDRGGRWWTGGWLVGLEMIPRAGRTRVAVCAPGLYLYVYVHG
jgi:hypothetical protein